MLLYWSWSQFTQNETLNESVTYTGELVRIPEDDFYPKFPFFAVFLIIINFTQKNVDDNIVGNLLSYKKGRIAQIA